MVRRGAGRVFSLFKTLSLRWRIRSTLLLLLPFSALAFWLTGLTALQTAALTGVNAALFFIVALCLETQISRPMEKLGQQAQGLTALTRAVDELDDITRQNATLVHEGAQASANVKHQATRLVDAVAVFR
ncbi:hypothetical protein [Dryocola sp. BD586]|uniref:hypothetical protein n=1 Tax=Dryocola sp. BD586 TaxID=3133271 RepID=UPI003F505BCB